MRRTFLLQFRTGLAADGGFRRVALWLVGAYSLAALVGCGSTSATAPPGGLGLHTVTVTTLAGGPQNLGFTNGTGSSARFYDPFALTTDVNGNIWVADSLNGAIRKVTPAGVTTTVIGVTGLGLSLTSKDGTGLSARIGYVHGISIAADMNSIFFTDGNGMVRRAAYVSGDITLPANWKVTTIAGSTAVGALDGPGSTATFNYPGGLAMAANGDLYVSEIFGNRVRKMHLTGADASLAANWVVSLVAGDNAAAVGIAGTTDATGSAARFDRPDGLALDTAGNLYVADYNNHRIRKISSTGVVTTVAGSVAGFANGVGAAAHFNIPYGVAVDSTGNIYVADANNDAIRRIGPDGTVIVIAGRVTVSGRTDGPGDVATFVLPNGVALDGRGNLYVADTGNSTIRKLTGLPP